MKYIIKYGINKVNIKKIEQILSVGILYGIFNIYSKILICTFWNNNYFQIKNVCPKLIIIYGNQKYSLSEDSVERTTQVLKIC